MAILPSWWGDVAPASLGGSDISGFADPGADAFARVGLDSSGNAVGATGAAGGGNLVQALQALSKADFAKQPANTPLGAATPREAAPGRPMQRLSLDALVQLLEKQRAAYGAMTGQPVARAQTLGLLGF